MLVGNSLSKALTSEITTKFQNSVFKKKKKITQHDNEKQPYTSRKLG